MATKILQHLYHKILLKPQLFIEAIIIISHWENFLSSRRATGPTTVLVPYHTGIYEALPDDMFEVLFVLLGTK